MDHHEAYRVLNIRPPFTERGLKSAFRAKVLTSHPDRGGTAEAFRAVKAAFDLLISDAGKDLEVNPVTRQVIDRTVEGVLLETLGKGLKVSATKCEGCKGNGYQSETRFSNCPACGGFAETGDYYYLLQIFSKRLSCLTCKGTGRGESTTVRYWVCMGCGGTGEIASFNPVFVKNAMHFRQQAQEQKAKHQKDLRDAGAKMKAQQQKMYEQKRNTWAELNEMLRKGKIDID
jgi:DnaJ-class molecular chaperone